MTTIILPPLPEPDEMAFESWMDSNGYLNSVLARRAWNAGILHIHTQLRARDLEVARVVLEGAAEYVSGWHLVATANAIRKLEFRHE